MSRFPEPYDPESYEGGTETGLALEEAPDPLLEPPGRRLTVLVTGARGFVGRELVPRLLHRGHRVRGLVRQLPHPEDRLDGEMDWWQADLGRPDQVEGAAEGCDRVVHLAGTSPTAVAAVEPDGVHRADRTLAGEAERAGVSRFLFMSALGADPGKEGFYGWKHRSEEELRERDFELLVFRPAVIYGPGDFLTTRLRRAARAGGWLPVPGETEFRLQPVAVEDVVEALCQGVERPGFEETVFELGGPRPLAFSEVVRAVGDAVGRRLRIVSLPGPMALPARKVLERVSGGAGLAPGEAEWLRRQGVLSGSEHALRTVFRLEPLPFEEVLRDYL